MLQEVCHLFGMDAVQQGTDFTGRWFHLYGSAHFWRLVARVPNFSGSPSDSHGYVCYAVTVLLLDTDSSCIRSSNLEPRPARLDQNWQRPYTISEAVAGFERAAATHGWTGTFLTTNVEFNEVKCFLYSPGRRQESCLRLTMWILPLWLSFLSFSHACNCTTRFIVVNYCFTSMHWVRYHPLPSSIKDQISVKFIDAPTLVCSFSIAVWRTRDPYVCCIDADRTYNDRSCPIDSTVRESMLRLESWALDRFNKQLGPSARQAVNWELPGHRGMQPPQ